MKRLIVVVFAILMLPTLCSAVKPGLMHGKLISAVQVNEGTQVLYRLRILVGRQLYDVEQRPIFFLNGYMAHEFFINGPVLVHMNDRYLYLMRPNGKEMRMGILRKRIVENDDEVAALNREADRPVPSDTVADMLNEAAERNRGLIPRGIPDGN